MSPDNNQIQIDNSGGEEEEREGIIEHARAFPGTDVAAKLGSTGAQKGGQELRRGREEKIARVSATDWRVPS